MPHETKMKGDTYVGKKQLTIFISIISIFIIIGCSNSSSTSSTAANNENNTTSDTSTISEEDKYGGHVVIREVGQPTSYGWGPEMSPPTNMLPAASPAMETLGRFNPDGTIGPWLAKDWDLDPDNKQITVYLEKGVKFHDGTDFNAEAVKYNLDLYIEEKRPLSVHLERVEVVDEHTFILHLSEWSSALLSDLFWIYPMMSPTAAKELGPDGLRFNPVGTGPFVFDSMQNDVYVKYVRNENYWKEGLPYLDSIEIRYIPDNNTALNSFLAKEIDVAIKMPGDIIADYEGTADFEIVEPATTVGLVGEGFVSNSLDPNSPFHDVRVRKAVTYAIDKNAIAESLFRGYVTPIHQFALPGEPNYNPDIEKFDYNPEKAKELLAEAGYPNGFKTTITGIATESIVMQAIQGYLAEVGIEADVNVVDQARWVSMFQEEGWDGLIQKRETAQAEIGSMLNPHYGPNATGWGMFTQRPEELYQLLEAFDLEVDQEKRAEIAREIQRVFHEEHHIATVLYYVTTPYIKHKHVQDDGFFTTRGHFFTPEKMWVLK